MPDFVLTQSDIADLFPEIDSLFIEGTLEPGLQIRVSSMYHRETILIT